jgi:hypothetical protein
MSYNISEHAHFVHFLDQDTIIVCLIGKEMLCWPDIDAIQVIADVANDCKIQIKQKSKIKVQN